MFELTEAERAPRMETRAISEGREVLVGLNEEETAFYMHRQRLFSAGIRDHAGKARFAELNRRHEAARCAVIAAENEKRNRNPPIQ